jgi:hypothetical protein
LTATSSAIRHPYGVVADVADGWAIRALAGVGGLVAVADHPAVVDLSWLSTMSKHFFSS